MAATGFRSLTEVDEGVFSDALLGAELQDWCALQQTCTWTCAAVSMVLPILKDARAPWESDSTNHAVDCCKRSDLTSLWAGATPGEELATPESVIMDPDNEDSLLHIAARQSVGENSLRVFRWLVTRPEAGHVAKSRNKRGQTPLHICARHNREEPARWFLRQPNAEKDAKDIYESTPLLDAVREEHLAMVRLLLEASADVNAFMPNCHGHGETPLILAVRLRNTEITRLLLQRRDIDLHQKSIIDVPFGEEALDFTVPGSTLHKLLQQAIHERATLSDSSEASDSEIDEPLPTRTVSEVSSRMSRTSTCDSLSALESVAKPGKHLKRDAYWSSRSITPPIETIARAGGVGAPEKSPTSALAELVVKICGVCGCGFSI